MSSAGRPFLMWVKLGTVMPAIGICFSRSVARSSPAAAEASSPEPPPQPRGAAKRITAKLELATKRLQLREGGMARRARLAGLASKAGEGPALVVGTQRLPRSTPMRKSWGRRTQRQVHRHQRIRQFGRFLSSATASTPPQRLIASKIILDLRLLGSRYLSRICHSRVARNMDIVICLPLNL